MNVKIKNTRKKIKWGVPSTNSYWFKNSTELRTAVKGYPQNMKQYGNISRWDVSKVTDMSDMFYNIKLQGDISRWDVSNVTNMKNMFKTSQFNGDISSWVVSNVTDMSYMFNWSQFQGDISRWDVSNVTNMSAMFSNSQFNDDISRWDVSKVTNMSYMFKTSQFQGDISLWDVSNVTEMNSMFDNSQFQGDISKWDFSKVHDMSYIFQGSAQENSSQDFVSGNNKKLIRKRVGFKSDPNIRVISNQNNTTNIDSSDSDSDSDSDENFSNTVSNKFLDAKYKKSMMNQFTKKKLSRLQKTLNKLKTTHNDTRFIKKFKSQYNNASNVSNSEVFNIYRKYGNTPARSRSQMLERVPKLYRTRGIREGLKIRKVNLREGAKIQEEMEHINSNYEIFLKNYETTYRMKIKWDKFTEFSTALKQIIVDYCSIIRAKLVKSLEKVVGYIELLFNNAFSILTHVIQSIGGIVLTFYTTTYGAVVWIYNKLGEIQTVILDCINNVAANIEYGVEIINVKIHEYLESISQTIGDVRESLSKGIDDAVIVLDDVYLRAVEIENKSKTILGRVSRYVGYYGAESVDKIVDYTYDAGIWALPYVVSALSSLGMAFRWSLRSAAYLGYELSTTAINLAKLGIFLVMQTPKLVEYMHNYCVMTYETLLGQPTIQGQSSAYRLPSKVEKDRNDRLLNGPRVKFYHKTTVVAAGSILKYKLFFRSEKGGFFGDGIYFCSNPNSTHNKSNPPDSEQTILEAEVLVGNIMKSPPTNLHSINYKFADLIAHNCDTVRGMTLLDDEYIVFGLDQICKVTEYTNPKGQWGYKYGKQHTLSVNHTDKLITTLKREHGYHHNWFPYENYKSLRLMQHHDRHSHVVKFNLSTPKKFTGSDIDLWNIYTNNIKGIAKYQPSGNTQKLSNKLRKRGVANPTKPILDYNIFLKFLHRKKNTICDKNKKPSYLKDNIF